METDSSCNHHLSFIDTLHGTWLQAESKALRYSGEGGREQRGSVTIPAYGWLTQLLIS